MKTIVIYDSAYGNTQKIAEAISEGASLHEKAAAVLAKDAANANWKSASLLVVGSPTQGGRPTKNLQAVLNSIPEGSLKRVNVAAFDTRFVERDQNIIVRLLMKTIQYAAEKIARILERKGGTLVLRPESFFVAGKEGPLLAGELERAKTWGEQLAKSC